MKRVIGVRFDNQGNEVYRREEIERYVPLKAYMGPWRSMMMVSGEGLEELEARLSDRSIGMQAVRVLFCMLKSVRLHDGNEVRAGRKDIAKHLNMAESNVSGAIKQLVECGFIEPPKLKFDRYVISPRFAWYGRTEDLRTALKQRGMLDDRGMMKSREAA